MSRYVERAALPFLVFLWACSAHDPTVATPTRDDYQYQVPEAIGDGWETTTLAEVGMDEAHLAQLMDDLNASPSHLVHSILVVRSGKLVFEEYFAGKMFSLAKYTGGVGFNRGDAHNLASVTKSITTTLMGIALDQGLVRSVTEPVFSFFPEHADLVAEDPRRAQMTLEDLMTMSSGMEWNDDALPYSDSRNDMVRMFNSEDPIRYALAVGLSTAPGTSFRYCNGNTNILGEVVRRATGQRLDEFAAAYLFAPLGIADAQWQMISQPRGVVFASGDLRLRPRDMAKIGQLFLNGGTWHGRSVVSPEWVAAATEPHWTWAPTHDWEDGYGYGWWHWTIPVGLQAHHAFLAAGWGGQNIVVLPDDDLVVVTTGGSYYDLTPMPAVRILAEYVLPALG